jgi:hypothetical protein
MKLEKKILKNGEVLVNDIQYIDRSQVVQGNLRRGWYKIIDTYHLVQGNLRGRKYEICILPDLEPHEMSQCFEIISKGNLVSLPCPGTDTEETLLEAYPLILDKIDIDEDKLTKKRIDQFASEIIEEAEFRIRNNFLDDFADSEYSGYVFLWKDRGPVIIVESNEWFDQNPNWKEDLYNKTPTWKI